MCIFECEKRRTLLFGTMHDQYIWNACKCIIFIFIEIKYVFIARARSLTESVWQKLNLKMWHVFVVVGIIFYAALVCLVWANKKAKSRNNWIEIMHFMDSVARLRCNICAGEQKANMLLAFLSVAAAAPAANSSHSLPPHTITGYENKLSFHQLDEIKCMFVHGHLYNVFTDYWFRK